MCSGVVADLVGGRRELVDLGVHELRDVESAVRVLQVVVPGLEQQFPPLRSLNAYRSNLPRALSRFVGRADDVTTVAKALAVTRVVSIVGPGGVGKTRLAQEVGLELVGNRADGVWWCELAALQNPDAVPEAVAAALGYAPSQGIALLDGLAGFFKHKDLVLALDNCEHLLDAVAAFVRTVTEAAPRLSVLTTSREALDIHGEQIFPLGSLVLPEDSSPFAVEASEAGALFAARAHDATGSFTVTSANAAAIADLCRRLDGNALAIELAAAHAKIMSPTEILARLDRRFRLLATAGRDAAPHHRSLETAIDWSYALLDPAEQALFQQLSVFIGDFDLDAVIAISLETGLDELDAVDHLGSLLAKSLVERAESTEVSRYRLLETIREFSADRLAASGGTERARAAHAAHYVTKGVELFAALDTSRDFEALELLRTETPNLVSGLRWLIASGHVEDVLAFFDDAGFCELGIMPFVLLDELGRVADEALRRHGAGATKGYIAALGFAGNRAFAVGDWNRQAEVVAAAAAVDAESIVIAAGAMGVAGMRDGDLARSVAIGNAAIERARQDGNGRQLSWILSLTSLGETLVDFPQALAHAEEAVAIARESPAKSSLIYPLLQLSFVLSALPTETDRALALAEECIRLDETHRQVWSTLAQSTAAKLRVDRGEIASGLRDWKAVFARLDWAGDVGFLVMQLSGVAEALAPVDPIFAVDLAAIADSGAIAPYAVLDLIQDGTQLARAVQEVGPNAVDAARARARAMAYEDALRYMLDNIERLIAATTDL